MTFEDQKQYIDTHLRDKATNAQSLKKRNAI